MADPGDTTVFMPLSSRISVGQAGDFIDRYQLLEELGSGGFGVVWRAQQTEPIKREVALKVIKPGMGSAEIVARFEAERQTLARMDHPNIAGVLDAGTTEHGLPYFVMELVKGVPITQFCDTHGFTIRQRLELFIPVCHAVQHAHQKAVLHRDLKPSNILVAQVDGQALPKVIDFGIAKALEASNEAVHQATLACTQEGMIVGTPQYMSPEQAGATAGADVDTRSDIYSLGVILYELLTGTTPLSRENLRHAAFDEVLRLIREADPVRPSSRIVPITELVQTTSTARGTEPARLQRTLRGELDWITLKALEKERERRYESAAALAQDIVRHLDNQPVEAGPPSALYRLRKLVRRNRLAFTAAAAILLLLVAGIGMSTWQAVRATRAETQVAAQLERVAAEKQRADQEAAVAKAVNEFLQNDLLMQASSRHQADSRAKPNPNLTVRQALDRASVSIGVRFQTQPVVEAAIRDSIGQAYLDLGESTSAIPHLRHALKIRTGVLGAEHQASMWTQMRLANALFDQGKYPEAEMERRAVLAIQERVQGAEHPDTLISRTCLANTLARQNKHVEAEAELRALLAVQNRVLGAEHPLTLTSRNNLADVLRLQGKHAEAEAEHRALLAIRKRVLGLDHPDISQSWHNLATVLLSQGRHAEAEAELRSVLAMLERVLGAEHPETLMSRYNLAIALDGQDKHAGAEAELRAVLAIGKRVLGAVHPGTLRTWGILAGTLQTQGKLAEAEKEFRAALAIQEHTSTAERTEFFIGCASIASLLAEQGKSQEALEFMKRAEEGFKKILGAEHPHSHRAQQERERIEEALMKQQAAQGSTPQPGAPGDPKDPSSR